jgi:hypothetical protein
MRFEEVPKHLRDKIKGVRNITSKSLGHHKDKEGNTLCKWCLSVVERPRKFWCSDHCSQEFKRLQDCPKLVYFKYSGQCAVCQKDVTKLQKYLNEVWDLYYNAETLRLKLERAKEDEEKALFKGNEYWSVKKGDVDLYQTMLINLHQFGKQFPHWSKKLKSGLVRPKKYKAYHIDHVKPVCEGGTTTIDNLRLVCTKCSEALTAELMERRRTKNDAEKKSQ